MNIEVKNTNLNTKKNAKVIKSNDTEFTLKPNISKNITQYVGDLQPGKIN